MMKRKKYAFTSHCHVAASSMLSASEYYNTYTLVQWTKISLSLKQLADPVARTIYKNED